MLEPRPQRFQIWMLDEIRKIALKLLEFWNLAPARNAKDFHGVICLQTQVAVLPLKTFAQNLTPVRSRFRNIHGMTANPRNPFGDLRLMAPGDVTNRVKSRLDVHRQVERIRAEHIAVVNV